MKSEVQLVTFAAHHDGSILAELHGRVRALVTGSRSVDVTMPSAILARRQESSACLLTRVNIRNCVSTSRADFRGKNTSQSAGPGGNAAGCTLHDKPDVS
jgi:hypothetical protein